MPPPLPEPADKLIALGFSRYEAQAYVGLLGREPMTGYALSNLTGVPQPKAYEILRRLERRGAAVATSGEPARFIAVPPTQLLSQLDAEFRHRLTEAEQGLRRAEPDPGRPIRVLDALNDWGSIAAKAVELLDGAERHAYVSVNCSKAADVLRAVRSADQRGTRVDVLHFGRMSLRLQHGTSVRHESTEGVLYRHHQARHLGVVVDSTRVLWALASDGTEWDAVETDDALIAAAVKGYIRHDIYVQRIAADFESPLGERYGPGLERLVVTPPDEEPPSSKRRSA